VEPDPGNAGVGKSVCLIFPTNFPEHMSTKPDKRNWLLGRWEIESEDSSPVFYITQKQKSGEVVVCVFDKYDGENFLVTGVRWENDALSFETFVPSTRWRARHVLHPVSKNRIRQELTLFENWKRTAAPEFCPGETPSPIPRDKPKKTKSKNL
jgi:hypothetical protein